MNFFIGLGAARDFCTGFVVSNSANDHNSAPIPVGCGPQFPPTNFVFDAAISTHAEHLYSCFIMKISPQMVKVGNITFDMSTKIVFLALPFGTRPCIRTTQSPIMP